MVTRVPLDAEVAVWARERVCLALADAAEMLKCPAAHLEEIEAGIAQPTAGLFRKMADKYGLPEATLLGITPTDDRALPHDFRSFEGVRVALSYQTAKTCRSVQDRQESLQYLSEVDEAVIAPTLKMLTLASDPEKEGYKFRQELGFSVIAQLGLSTQKAYIKWRTLVESLGVSVYVEPLGEDESRGVSVFFNDFPAIVIDQKEKHNGARLFTLFHELAHILLRQTGISDLRGGSRVEAYCNRFAAAFLMPPEAIRAVFQLENGGQIDPSLLELEAAARKLCTTISQVALRLEQLRFAKVGYFKKIVSGLNFTANSEKKPSKGGPEYRYNFLSQYGHYLTKSVLTALDQGSIASVEAARILHANPVHFGTFRATVKEREIELLDVIG